MAKLTLYNATYYKAGTPGVSDVVGYESSANRVARYTMVAPATGANRVALTFTGISQGNGTPPTTLRFFIGTDQDDHANAGAGSTYTGTLTRTTVSGLYTFSGAADVILMPNTTYYVWVFPANTTYGWLAWPSNTGTAEVTGGAISTLTAGNGTLGVRQTLTVTRYNTSFTHNIVCTIGSASETICTNSKATSVPWTPSLELARQIPNAAKGTATLTITTYNGSTLIGSQAVTVELAVPADIVPTVSATWTDTSGAEDKMGTFVKLVSTLAVDVVGVGAYGSTITGAVMTLNGKPYTGGAIMDAGDLDLVVTVSDSRGRSGSVTYTIEVADYSAPSLTLNASRCLADGTADDMGEYALVTITGTVVQVNGVNTATVALTYGSKTDTIQLQPGAINYTQIIPAPSVSTLAISATLSDRLLSATANMALSIGYATVDYYAGGKGIAFGTTAKQEGFTCAMDATFSGRVTGIPTPEQDSDAVPKSYADRAKDYITGVTYNNAGYYARTWNGGGGQHTAPRAFFNSENNDILGWANSMMKAGFDGVAHIQMGGGAAPVDYCMGILVSNGIDRANIVLFGLTAIYANINYGGTWQGWRKVNTTAV